MHIYFIITSNNYFARCNSQAAFVTDSLVSIYLPTYLSIYQVPRGLARALSFHNGTWQLTQQLGRRIGEQHILWVQHIFYCYFGCSNIGYLSPSNVNINKNHIYIIQPLNSPFVYLFPAKRWWCQSSVKLQVHAFLCHVFWKHNKSFPFEFHIKDTCLPQLCMPLKYMFNLLSFIWQSLLWETRAKNWQSHGRQWRVKTD